jgi:hypothetical protein
MTRVDAAHYCPDCGQPHRTAVDALDCFAAHPHTPTSPGREVGR